MSTPARRAALLERIHTRKARVGVIGLGYVGLPLAVEFARGGFDVTGFDVDPEKVAVVNAGRELHSRCAPGRPRGGRRRRTPARHD
jgi:UDP-N-acetyl-D-glucosamine dehydrogenase